MICIMTFKIKMEISTSFLCLMMMVLLFKQGKICCTTVICQLSISRHYFFSPDLTSILGLLPCLTANFFFHTLDLIFNPGHQLIFDFINCTVSCSSTKMLTTSDLLDLSSFNWYIIFF